MPGANRLYVARNKRSSSVPGVALGPNLLSPANGPYTVGNWQPTGLTETTGQTDPLGGSTASLLTDTAVLSAHSAGIPITLSASQKYLATAYWKPGTYPNGINVNSLQLTFGVSLTNAGVSNATNGSPTNISVSSVNGFYKLTFNFIASGTETFFIFNFNTNPLNNYTGSLQNGTFWGMALQTST